MNELIYDENVLESEVRQTSFGILTYLNNKSSIAYKSQIGNNDETIIASYVYGPNTSYDLVYTRIDNAGKVLGHYKELDGILPTLFKSPANIIWISIVPYHPDKEMEITIPLFDRSSFELPKSNRPFAGEFLGTTQNSAHFISCDNFSPNKPDKFLRIEFKNGLIKKKHNFKIELPSQNNGIIIDNQIHLLGIDGSIAIHRILDENGKTTEQREFPIGSYYFTKIVSLSFTETSKTISISKGCIYLISISPSNEVSERLLLNIGHDIYYLWNGIELSNGKLLFRFTHEKGNGWFVINNDKIIECFIQGEQNGYKNLISEELINLGYDDTILSGANRTSENGYALSFYPRTETNVPNNTLIILSRLLE